MFWCKAIARQICHVYIQVFLGWARKMALLPETCIHYPTSFEIQWYKANLKRLQSLELNQSSIHCQSNQSSIQLRKSSNHSQLNQSSIQGQVNYLPVERTWACHLNIHWKLNQSSIPLGQSSIHSQLNQCSIHCKCTAASWIRFLWAGICKSKYGLEDCVQRPLLLFREKL